MVWSAIIGAGASLIGSSQASSAQKYAASVQRAIADQQANLANSQLTLAANQNQERQEYNNYLRQIDRINQRIREQEKKEAISRFEDYRDDKQSERQYFIDRQMEQDRDAARQREFYLNQLLQNQELKQSERETALRELEYVKSVARGERDEDIRNFYEERARAVQERDYALGKFEQATANAQAERELALTQQAALYDRIAQLQAGLAAYEETLQDVPSAPVLDRAAIDAETRRRTSEYMSDIDRAADKVASVNEANLIRGGMDASTVANQRRSDITARLAQEYSNARTRAYDDALKYITGQTSAMTTNAADIAKLRDMNLSTASSILGAGLDLQSRIGAPLSSANSAMGYLSAVPSAIYNRRLESANDFRAPLTVGSGIYDNIRVGSELGSFLTPSSAAVLMNQVPSMIRTPYDYRFDANNYMGNAISAYGDMGRNASGLLAGANQRSAAASKALGSSFDTLFKESGLDAKLDSWWNSLDFGSMFGSTPSETWDQNADEWDFGEYNPGFSSGSMLT